MNQITAERWLQAITLALLGFMWQDLRDIKRDIANARERLHAVEALQRTPTPQAPYSVKP